MAARLSDLEGMPYWPRFLSREQAAAYLGVSAETFDDEVEEGLWPAGMRRGKQGRRITWDRVALDRAADRANDLTPDHKPGGDDDYEARKRKWREGQGANRPAHAG
jgi:hypothetical protein